MLGYISSWVRLDEKFKEAMVFIGRDWRIGANDFFGLAFDCCRDRDVLPNREA